MQQHELSMTLVEEWKRTAANALSHKELVKIPLTDSSLDFYHYEKSSMTGVFFAAHDGKIAYLYSYTKCKVAENVKAAEALAYVFDPEARGIMKQVFFDHLLPHLKFVVTDYLYTPQGKAWFEAEYNTAFARGHTVYAIDLQKGITVKVDKAAFKTLQPLYWGTEDSFRRYRFAIEKV